MINIEKALEIVQNSPIFPESEKVNISESLNRVIFEDIYSEIDIPSFNKSRIDGYAYNSTVQTDFYIINEVLPAGEIPLKAIEKGFCAKIMTGAIIPEGADSVVRKEFVEENDNKIRILQKEENSNISCKGQFIKKREKILSKGEYITPAKMGLLVSCGINNLKVYKQPIIGIIITGNEISEPDKTRGYAQVFNSNGHILISLIKNMHLNFKYYGICPDNKEKLTAIINQAFNECDLVLVSGGVSKGDFDFVPKVLEETDTEIKFHGVKVKPGKPILFGNKIVNNKIKYVFGLPGNPVSCFICFDIFIKHLVCLMQGFNYKPLKFKGVLNQDFSRIDSSRTEFIPVFYDGENIYIKNYSTSDNIKSLAGANAIIKIEEGETFIKQGETVYARQI